MLVSVPIWPDLPPLLTPTRTCETPAQHLCIAANLGCHSQQSISVVQSCSLELLTQMVQHEVHQFIAALLPADKLVLPGYAQIAHLATDLASKDSVNHGGLRKLWRGLRAAHVEVALMHGIQQCHKVLMCIFLSS